MNILIIELHLTDKGVRLIDVDGSSVEITAEDALEFGAWIEKHKAELKERVPHGRAPEREDT